MKPPSPSHNIKVQRFCSMHNILLATLFLTGVLVPTSQGFVSTAPPTFARPWGLRMATDTTSDVTPVDTTTNIDQEQSTAVRAPLKYIGPYPCLALRFPHLATSNQRSKNETGVSLDFVLDTAANTNTINGQVAQELKLEVVGAALPGVSSSGVIPGAETFMLGDAQLEGIGDNFTFMTNLSASALPIASPAVAGLLSLAFLQSFPGGVDLDWGSVEAQRPPSITFYGESQDKIVDGRTKVNLERIPVTQLMSLTVNINGVSMPALLDTGSPVTVLNHQAAKLAGIETVEDPDGGGTSKNPFSAFASRFQQAQKASKGEILTIMGPGGKPVNLLKSTSPTKITTGDVSFDESSVYVGDLPGLAALNGIGIKSPPAVVLGMDVLRQKRMLLRAAENEVWFD